MWDRAKPGLIAINSKGQRFVNESTSYHDFVTAIFENGEDYYKKPAYLVCDEPFLRKWGLGLVQPGTRKKKKMFKAGYLIEADGLVDLADKLNVDAETLSQSIYRYNRDAAKGIDSDFGKGSDVYNRSLGDANHKPNPCLRPLEGSKYYAVKVYPGDIGTSTGLITNEKTQVLTEDNQVIRGLYALGNDMQSIFVGKYAGSGITLGPAIAFAWVCSKTIAT